MFGWLLRHWRALAGAATLIPAAIKGALALITFGSDVDFIVSRSQDPGWVGKMINWIIDPPGWAIVPLIVLGLAFIYWDVRRRGARSAPAENPIKPEPDMKPNQLVKHTAAATPEQTPTEWKRPLAAIEEFADERLLEIKDKAENKLH
jgi:hypothetical protein